MKAAVDDSVFGPERSSDEETDGEYGLVINGHSLVRHHLNYWLFLRFCPC